MLTCSPVNLNVRSGKDLDQAGAKQGIQILDKISDFFQFMSDCPGHGHLWYDPIVTQSYYSGPNRSLF